MKKVYHNCHFFEYDVFQKREGFMKKKVLLIVFCLIAVCVYGQDISAFWGMGSVDYSLYESENIKWSYMNNVELFDVSIRDNATGLYLNLTPFHFDGFPSNRAQGIPEEKAFMSFFNAMLSWNILKSPGSSFMGPYALIEWNPFVSMDCYRTELGFEIASYSKDVVGKAFPLKAKTGFAHVSVGLRRGEPYFTVGLGLDVFSEVYRTIFGDAFMLQSDENTF